MLEDIEFMYVKAPRGLALVYRKKIDGIWSGWLNIYKEEE